jgi:hypothetical protein
MNNVLKDKCKAIPSRIPQFEGSFKRGLLKFFLLLCTEGYTVYLVKKCDL